MFERNLEVYEIVEFIFSEDKKVLSVTGDDRCGKSLLIAKGIWFSLKRKPQLNVFKVDLTGVITIDAAIVKISETLYDDMDPEANEKGLLKHLSTSANCLIYFTKCDYLENGQADLVELFKKIARKPAVKVIVQFIEFQDSVL